MHSPLSDPEAGCNNSFLNAALKDAIRWKRLALNVCDAVSPSRLSPTEIHPLGKEETRRLLTMALATGMHSKHVKKVD